VNREFVYHILVDVAKAAQKVIDGKWWMFYYFKWPLVKGLFIFL
jgi:hypothetical protein